MFDESSMRAVVFFLLQFASFTFFIPRWPSAIDLYRPNSLHFPSFCFYPLRACFVAFLCTSDLALWGNLKKNNQIDGCVCAGYANPRFLRSTMYNVPCTSDMLKASHIPFALALTPFARLGSQEVGVTLAFCSSLDLSAGCVCVCVRERKIECVCVCMWEREKDRVCVCVCMWEREKDRECVCVYVRERER